MKGKILISSFFLFSFCSLAGAGGVRQKSCACPAAGRA